MKFTELYVRAIACWPEEIYVGDGVESGESGYFFPTLTKAWDNAEQAVEEHDQWLSLAVWCTFQAFHAAAKRSLGQGPSVLQPRDIPLHEIEFRLAENLQGDGWAKFALEYENDLPLS